jgi:prepilin-type N-terminal cleavage/methylation domain-containing protein
LSLVRAVEVSRRTEPQRETPARGFTLIELMVVVLLFGVIAAAVVPAFLDKAEQARTAREMANRRMVEAAVARYEVEHEAPFGYVRGPDRELYLYIGSSESSIWWQLYARTDVNGNPQPDPGFDDVGHYAYGPYLNLRAVRPASLLLGAGDGGSGGDAAPTFRFLVVRDGVSGDGVQEPGGIAAGASQGRDAWILGRCHLREDKSRKVLACAAVGRAAVFRETFPQSAAFRCDALNADFRASGFGAEALLEAGNERQFSGVIPAPAPAAYVLCSVVPSDADPTRPPRTSFVAAACEGGSGPVRSLSPQDLAAALRSSRGPCAPRRETGAGRPARPGPATRD